MDGLPAALPSPVPESRSASGQIQSVESPPPCPLPSLIPSPRRYSTVPRSPVRAHDDFAAVALALHLDPEPLPVLDLGRDGRVEGHRRAVVDAVATVPADRAQAVGRHLGAVLQERGKGRRLVRLARVQISQAMKRSAGRAERAREKGQAAICLFPRSEWAGSRLRLAIRATIPSSLLFPVLCSSSRGVSLTRAHAPLRSFTFSSSLPYLHKKCSLRLQLYPPPTLRVLRSCRATPSILRRAFCGLLSVRPPPFHFTL